MESMLKSIWGSIVTPGVGRGLFIALNVSLGLLFAALIFITVVGYADIHVAVMGFLALGLTVSVNWCVLAPLLRSPPRQPPTPAHPSPNSRRVLGLLSSGS